MMTTARCRGWPVPCPGRLLPGPCLAPGVSAEAPGSSVTSRVRLPGTFPPVLVVPRARSRLGLEGRARTLSGPSPVLSPADALVCSGSIPRMARPGLPGTRTTGVV